MGVIVGSQTYLECEECGEKSTPIYDQKKAVDSALEKGWFKSQLTGKTLCPKCRNISQSGKR